MTQINNVGWSQTAVGGNYVQSQTAAGKDATAEAQTSGAQQNLESTYNPENVLTAMQTLGAYNLVNVNKTDASAVDPTKYLSEERIADIEAMMAEFDDGVEELAVIIDEELPDDVSQATINALAASLYAQE